MLFIGCEDSLEVEKLLEDLPEHPEHPPPLDGAEGDEKPGDGGKKPGPLPGIGGLMKKGSLPEGVIILV